MRRDTAYKEQDIKLYDVRDFQEDWDSKEHLQKMAAKRKKKGKGSAKQTTAQGSSKQSQKEVGL